MRRSVRRAAALAFACLAAASLRADAIRSKQEDLRRELRAYYARLLTPEVEEQLAHSNGVGPDMRRVVKQMAQERYNRPVETDHLMAPG